MIHKYDSPPISDDTQNHHNLNMTTHNQANSSATRPLPPSAAAAAARKPACAACRHRRHRCTAQCPLAPYFPANKQEDFFNVNRLFGVANVVELLKNVAAHHRDDAVKSIIYEANYRAKNDPVGGCYAAVKELHRRIELCEAELEVVKKNLVFHRQRLMLQGFNENPFFNNQETDSMQFLNYTRI